MREELEEVEEADAAEQPALEEDEPTVLEHADLAAVLVLEVAGGLVLGDGVRFVDRTPSALHHEIRKCQVVAEARVDLDVIGATDSVNRKSTRLNSSHVRISYAVF